MDFNVILFLKVIILPLHIIWDIHGRYSQHSLPGSRIAKSWYIGVLTNNVLLAFIIIHHHYTVFWLFLQNFKNSFKKNVLVYLRVRGTESKKWIEWELSCISHLIPQMTTTARSRISPHLKQGDPCWCPHMCGRLPSTWTLCWLPGWYLIRKVDQE